MPSALLFSVADKLRSFKSQADVLDMLLREAGGDLRDRIAGWKKDKLDIDAIRESLTGEPLEALKADLPDRFQFVLEPISQLDDHLIDLGDWSKEDATAVAPVKVTASLAGSVELDGVVDKDLEGVLRGPVPTGSALFTVSMNGKIAIDASGDAATQPVSLSVAAGASRSQTLTVGHVRDADEPVLFELLRMGAYVVNPSDLAAVMDSFSDSTSRVIQHHYTGTHSLGLKVAVEKGLAEELRKIISNPAVAPSGEVGLSFSVNFKNNDDFALTIERDSASSAFVHLSRKNARERSTVFKLGASVEIKGLKDEIVNRIGELLPDSQKVKDSLAKLDELVREVDGDGLSQLIKSELENRFQDHKSLFGALLGDADVDKIEEKILDELAATLTDRVNERVDVLNDEATAASNSVALDVSAALGLDANAALELHDFLAASLSSAISKLQATLDQRIKDLAANESDVLQAVLEPFAKATAAIDGAIANLGKKTVAAIGKVEAGIKEVYGKYTNFRQRLIELVNERVAEQVAFMFMKERTDTSTDSSLISFRIVDAGADGVAELYRAIWSRRIDDAFALLRTAQQSAGITDVEGSYVSTLNNQERAELTLNLFGVTASTSVIFSDDVSVGVDFNGKLVVAKTKAELDVARHRGSESQVLSAEWTLDVLDEDTRLLPPIKISIDVGDTDFGKDDLLAFFGSLNKLGCVKADAFDSVGADLLGGVNSTKRLKGVTLGLVVALRWSDLSAILGVNVDGSPSDDKWQSADIQRRLFSAIKRGHTDPDYFGELESTARLEHRDPLSLLIDDGALDSAPKQVSEQRDYSAIGRSMILLQRHLNELQKKWPALLTELRKPGAAATTNHRAQMFQDINEELRAMLVALFLNNTFAAFPRDLSEVWQVAAGMRVLLDRAQRDYLLLTIEGPGITRRIIS